MEIFVKENFLYTPFFCEENIWWLGRSLLQQKISAKKIKVLIISNPQQNVLLWQQRLAEANDQPLSWDYHVILLYSSKFQHLVFDFDSLLPFPIPFNQYFAQTFPANFSHEAFVRLIPILSYHRHFHSDRSHMENKTETFPDYPPLLVAEQNKRIPLMDYIDMEAPLRDSSRVYSLADFLRLYKR